MKLLHETGSPATFFFTLGIKGIIVLCPSTRSLHIPLYAYCSPPCCACSVRRSPHQGSTEVNFQNARAECVAAIIRGIMPLEVNEGIMHALYCMDRSLQKFWNNIFSTYYFVPLFIHVKFAFFVISFINAHVFLPFCFHSRTSEKFFFWKRWR